MWPPSIGRVIILSWIASELLAYAVFFQVFPVWAGFLIGLGSTMLGIAALRLLGARIFEAAKAQLEAGTIRVRAAPYAVIGAILLILPGFLSDFAGLALVLAGGRAFVRPARAANPREIELEQHEWTRRPDDAPGR